MGNRTRHFPSSARVVRATRRETAWLQFVPTVQVLTAVNGTIIFTLNAAALALRPFTVVRTRFMVYLRSDQTAAAEDQVVGLGHAVVSDEAVAVGVTAVPTPIAQLGSDLWFAIDVLATGVQDAAGGTSGGIRGITRFLDSRAMRKVAVGQDIVSVAEFSSQGQGLQIIWGGRMLVKLH